MQKQRSSFTGKIGFVLAAAGSAVGLGNIWRFPYLAAQYGGGIFLLTYLVLAVTFGFALMTAEIAIGRKTGLSAIGAFEKLNKKYAFIGILASFVPVIILPYYSVIGGWVTKYFFVYITGDGVAAANDSYFGEFTAMTWQPIGWFMMFLGITALTVIFGVEKGVEKASKILMPILILLSIIIAIYVATMPGAVDGVVYYLKPDITKFSVKTVLGAMGQLFYSMSLAMGIMITYGSYMKKDVKIESSVRQIEFFDTGIAFLAGLMIIPALFATGGGEEAASKSGATLMFVVLPKVFAEMPAGNLVGIAFFLMVLFAALTSSISLMETIVSIVQDKFKIGRIPSSLIIFVLCIIMGLPSTLGYGILSHIKIIGMDILDFFDFISNSVIMPFVALLTCIFVGYVIKPKTLIKEIEYNGKFKANALFVGVIKYFAPVCIILILVSAVLGSLDIITI